MKGFLSGILITLGAFAYLNIGGIVGALLFAFGIICVVKLQIPLYTGIAGTDAKSLDKFVALITNIAGAIFASGLLYIVSKPEVIDLSQSIALAKVNSAWYITLIKAIMCGVIVDISVFLSKKDNSVIPLIFGIPLFILCGFNHSIADVAYISLGITNTLVSWKLLLYYITCVVGNYLGCNIRKFTYKLS